MLTSPIIYQHGPSGKPSQLIVLSIASPSELVMSVSSQKSKSYTRAIPTIRKAVIEDRWQVGACCPALITNVLPCFTRKSVLVCIMNCMSSTIRCLRKQLWSLTRSNWSLHSDAYRLRESWWEWGCPSVWRESENICKRLLGSLTGTVEDVQRRDREAGHEG